mmetsp:Transcript_36182/g.85782  ORF Transcript_36182/g.85782 Transcript_36182/m.85782 type:complete len:381 (-) Transcript_36182:17-1159(-)
MKYRGFLLLFMLAVPCLYDTSYSAPLLKQPRSLDLDTKQSCHQITHLRVRGSRLKKEESDHFRDSSKPLDEGSDPRAPDSTNNGNTTVPLVKDNSGGKEMCSLQDFHSFVNLLGLGEFASEVDIEQVFNDSVARKGTAKAEQQLNFTDCAEAVCELAARAGVEEILPGHWGAVKAVPVSKFFKNANPETPRQRKASMGRKWNAPCRAVGCKKLPSFGTLAQGTPAFCSQHRPKDGLHVDLRSAECQAFNCSSRASFRAPEGRRKLFCGQHRPEGFISSARLCRFAEGCSRQASYGDRLDRTPRSCARHKRDGDVLLKRRQCSHGAGCELQPVYGVAGQNAKLAKGALFCRNHREAFHVNVVSRTKREKNATAASAINRPT